MSRAKLIATPALILFTVIYANEGGAQSVPRVDYGSSPNAESAADALRTIDQLAEQNKKLEQQNQELMNQLQKLRAVIAQQSSAESNSPSDGTSAESANVAVVPAPETAPRGTDDVKDIAVGGVTANTTQPTPPTHKLATRRFAFLTASTSLIPALWPMG